MLTLAVLGLLRHSGIEVGTTVTLLLMIGLTQGVAFWSVALIQLLRLGRAESAARIGLRRPRPDELRAAAATCGWALAGAAVGGGLAPLLGLEPAENELLRLGREDPTLLLIMMPVAVLIVGPGEELLFRGIVQTRLRDAFSPLPAVLMASLIFAGVHVFSLAGPWHDRLVTVLVLLLPSMVFGLAYERHKNLWVPALAHGLYDFVLLGLAYGATQAEQLQALAAAIAGQAAR